MVLVTFNTCHCDMFVKKKELMLKIRLKEAVLVAVLQVPVQLW